MCRNHPKFDLKGIVHPKMKIMSSFTLPQVVPNLYECVCSAEHKGRYSEECGKQSSSGAPLTSIVFIFPTMEVNGAPKQPDYKLSSEYLPLCSGRTKTFIQVWNYLRVIKWWQNFHFWVNYPFKIISQICVCAVHRMNVRTEIARTPLFQMWNLWIANDLELARNWLVSALCLVNDS